MKKIIIQGTSRTASKLYREILNKVDDVVILHEIVFDFKFKNDVHSTLKKHKAYTIPKNIRPAINELYSNEYFKRIKAEYPDKETLISALEQQKNLNWGKALNVFIEQKAKNKNVKISGAKNPVHFSYTKKLLNKLENVKVLYLLRDPRAMYASEIHQKMVKQPLSNFPQLKLRFLQRWLIFFHSTIEWVWAIKTYRKVRNEVILCRYEELVNEPDKLMKRIFQFCDLIYSKSYLEELSVINSSHNVNNKGISTHGIEKWKRELNSFEFFWFSALKKIFKY